MTRSCTLTDVCVHVWSTCVFAGTCGGCICKVHVWECARVPCICVLRVALVHACSCICRCLSMAGACVFEGAVDLRVVSVCSCVGWGVFVEVVFAYMRAFMCVRACVRVRCIHMCTCACVCLFPLSKRHQDTPVGSLFGVGGVESHRPGEPSSVRPAPPADSSPEHLAPPRRCPGGDGRHPPPWMTVNTGHTVGPGTEAPSPHRRSLRSSRALCFQDPQSTFCSNFPAPPVVLAQPENM